jgi:asparagine synthase (glutamine-hydrolysing)
MCGIFGALTIAPNRPPERESFEGMSRKLKHRGPDGVAMAAFSHATLGLNRLAIVGTRELAHVPVLDGVASVMNGEIYNHRALRAGLEKQGVRIASQSDTALVPALFRAKGPDFIDALQGPFAIALYEEKPRRLHLIRDRLGKKPLFFASHRGSVYFASEQKALLGLPGWKPRINFATAQSFLQRGALEEHELLFEGVERVAPGEWVTITASGRITPRTWWSLFEVAKGRVQPLAPAHARAMLVDAVKSRLPEEVKGTLLLSGGLDSTLVGRLARSGLEDALCMNTPSQRASGSATKAARLLNLPLRVTEQARPTPSRFFEALWHLETPDEASTWAMAPGLFQLGRQTRAGGAKVALSGEGADELFLGYGWDLLQASHQRGTGDFPRDARQMLGKRLQHYGLFHSVETLYTPFPRAREVWRKLAVGAVDNLASQNSAQWLLHLGGAVAPPPSIDGPPNARGRQLYGLAYDMLTLPVLHADRLLMASGVEARLPFLDHRLVELMLRCPLEALEKPGVDKPLLRRWAKRWLPQWRPPPKEGFSAPATPSPRVLHELVRTLRRQAPLAVAPRFWRSSRHWADPVRLGALWRAVALESAAQVMVQGPNL